MAATFYGIRRYSGPPGATNLSSALSKKADEVMLNLKSSISTIEKLLEQSSGASFTYAARECRLAIERICYERLRSAHDYISHDDLKKWRPQDIVKIVMEEVNPLAAETFTVSISTEPLPEGSPPSTLEEYQSMNFVPVGTQTGFDPNKLGRLWQALANLALHVSVPSRVDDSISQYGDIQKIKAKVEEAVEEIKRIEKGTLISSGIGKDIWFDCTCGAKNRRRSDLLKDGQTISCINPECKESYEYLASEFSVQRRIVKITCWKCGERRKIAKKIVEKLPTDQSGYFDCIGCGERISIFWRLAQDQKTRSNAEG